MKKIFTLVIASLFALPCLAQIGATDIETFAKTVAGEQTKADTTYWVRGGVGALNLSQASFTNWAAGGDPSIAFDAGVNYFINYMQGRRLWTNRLELAYGLNTSDTNGTRKTNDKIYLSSNYGYLIVPKLYASAILTFNTQFDKGYDYKVSSTDYLSKFMAPGYLSVGVGVTWIPKPWFTLTFSPASWRGTFVEDDKLSAEGAYGVDPGKRFLNEFGANVKAEVNTPLWSILSLYTRLELYSNYLKDPQNIDIRWDIQLNLALTKWLTANLYVNMLYDDDVKFKDEAGNIRGSRFQVKEVAGIGFQVKF